MVLELTRNWQLTGRGVTGSTAERGKNPYWWGSVLSGFYQMQGFGSDTGLCKHRELGLGSGSVLILFASSSVRL